MVEGREGGEWILYQCFNCKFKTFGFLNTLKVNIQYNYLASKLLNSPSNKTSRKKQQTYFFMLFALFRFKSVMHCRVLGRGHWPLPPLLCTPLTWPDIYRRILELFLTYCKVSRDSHGFVSIYKLFLSL